MTNLIDELDRKQVFKFQLNNLDRSFIKKTLSKNNEGIFNLPSKMEDYQKTDIMIHLLTFYKLDYDFELEDNLPNPQIYFKKC